MNKKPALFAASLLTALLVAAGCGNNIKVSGKVTLTDGTPVPGGRIVFISGVNQGKGNIGPDGTYRLSFQKKDDGIPPGEYVVLISGAFFKPKNLVATDEMDEGSRPMVDLKYAETETSPLTCSVPSESYNFDVEPSKVYLDDK